MAALHETFTVRQCTDRLPLTPTRSPCVLAEMQRCLSPCDGSVDVDTYAGEVDRLRTALREDADQVVEALTRRMAVLAEGERVALGDIGGADRELAAVRHGVGARGRAPRADPSQ